MLKVAVFTGSRAEYGLLYWLLKDITESTAFKLQLIVAAMHLSPEFGYTKSQIEQDGFVIDEAIEMLLSSDSSVGCAKSVGLGIIGFADALQRLAPDILIVLGDRFEALAIAQTAMLMDIPVAHIHGGELTLGAKDDAIRHAITKLSTLHFTATEVYRQRVIQLGESPDRVFNVGALGLESINRSPLLSRDALMSSLNFDLSRPYFLVTYHAATLAHEDPKTTMMALLKALDCWQDHQIIITYPNADDGGRQMIPLLEAYAKNNPLRVFVCKSLGMQRYLSAVKYACAVIGNSSSGIIEVPSFGVATINIGDRQKGRICADSVIHCHSNEHAIATALASIFDAGFQASLMNVKNPYGAMNTSEQILSIIQTVSLSTEKKFYDIEEMITRDRN